VTTNTEKRMTMENIKMTERDLENYKRHLEKGTFERELFNRTDFKVKVKGISEEIKRQRKLRRTKVARARRLRERYGNVPYKITDEFGRTYAINLMRVGGITSIEAHLSIEARMLNVATGFIKGIPYNQVEPNCKDTVSMVNNVPKLEKLVEELLEYSKFDQSVWDWTIRYRFHHILQRYEKDLEKIPLESRMKHAILLWLA